LSFYFLIICGGQGQQESTVDCV